MKLQQQHQPWMTMNMVEHPHPHSTTGGGGGDRTSVHNNPNIDSSALPPTAAFPTQQYVVGAQTNSGLLPSQLVDTSQTPGSSLNMQLAAAGVNIGNYTNQVPVAVAAAGSSAPGFVVAAGAPMYNQPPQPGYELASSSGFGVPVMGAQIRTSNEGRAGQPSQQAGQGQGQRGADDSPMVGVCVQQSPVATH